MTDVVGGTIGMTDVNVELDGNTAEGVLNFATDGRKTLQGTLAADTLDLTPYMSTVHLLTANQREWNSGRITLDGLSGMDIDLRLSAANVVMANAKIGRTAIAANLRGGQLTVTVGEAQAYDGVIKGSLALANFDAGVDVKSQLQFTDVDLEACLGQLFGLHRLEGKGNIALTVEGSGASVLGVTRTLNGTASADRRKRRACRHQCRAIAAAPRTAAVVRRRRIPQRPHALRQDDGDDEDRPGRDHGREREDRWRGGAACHDRLRLDPRARSRPQGHGGAGGCGPSGRSPVRAALCGAGSWDDPIMLPDAEALIRRSGAAAPLLNAVRQRSTRDAVRSVIERLTGAAPAAAPAAAIPAAEQAATPVEAPAQKPE